MLSLYSSWIAFFCAFYLCALSCAVIARRGLLPLHIAALAGIGAYTFAATGDGTLAGAARAALAGILASVMFGAATSIPLLRVRGVSAALYTIAVQFAAEEVFRGSSWTGGSQGLWTGLPHLSWSAIAIMSASALVVGVAAYRRFDRSDLARVTVADGHNAALAASLALPTFRAVAFAGGASGALAGLGGLILVVQLGLSSPGSFTLASSLLYVGAVVLAGFRRWGSLATASAVFCLFPQLLRRAGLGAGDSSSWQGVIVGGIVVAIVALQRPSSTPVRLSTGAARPSQ